MYVLIKISFAQSSFTSEKNTEKNVINYSAILTDESPHHCQDVSKKWSK